jgi:hypothetical protein
VARSLLPTYGGTSAVWTTALVFFQTTLLAGYAWAHLTLTAFGVRRHAVVQVALVVLALGGLLVAPLVVPPFARPLEGAPTALWLVAVLAAIVGLPFFALSSASPTTQRWFAALPGGAEPYRLFAASNAGSLVGLLAYPTIVEPNLDLPVQVRLWTTAFAVFVAATVGAAWVVRRRGVPLTVPEGVEDVPPPSRRARLRWVAFAAIPAALLIGVTTDISTDIAAVPFLWVVPLTVYLATLILAFVRATPIGDRIGALALPILAVLVAVRGSHLVPIGIWPSIGLLLATLAAAGLALHGRVARTRPAAAHLTGYSLLVATGGALGGIATGLIAPLAFRIPIEGLLTVAAAVWFAGRSRPYRAVAGPAVAAVGLVIFVTAAGTATTIRTDRSFYGVYRVVEPSPGLHVLYSGTTVHGRETFTGRLAGQPLSYYHRNGPLGEVIDSLQSELPALRIGAVGLGTGAVAAYPRATDSLWIAEIDPTVVAIAHDPASFTFLRDTAGRLEVVVGDGRLELESIPPDSFDLLVLDAFSSDAVPVHLLTVESFATAMRTVASGGVIAVHVSNRFLDLEPVVASAARELGFVSIIGSDLPPPELADLADASQWIVVGRSFADVADLASGDRWRTAHADGHRAWTDRYSDLLGALRQ